MVKFRAWILVVLQWFFLRTLGVYSPGRFVIDPQYRQDVLRYNNDPKLVDRAKRIDDYFEGLKRDRTSDLLYAEQNNWEGVKLYSSRSEALAESGNDNGFYIVYNDSYKYVNISDIPLRPTDDLP